MRQLAIGIVVVAALAGTAELLHTASMPTFVEAGTSSGLNFRFRNSATSRKYLIETMGGGVAIFDYDNDGWLDLFIARYLEWDFQRGGIFCGVQGPGGRAYCHPDEFKPAANYLFRNNCDGTFSDVSASSGIAAIKGKALGVAFGDF